nr:MAG TPA: hypothetical protein [Crassvirales sp.]
MIMYARYGFVLCRAFFYLLSPSHIRIIRLLR